MASSRARLSGSDSSAAFSFGFSRRRARAGPRKSPAWRGPRPGSAKCAGLPRHRLQLDKLAMQVAKLRIAGELRDRLMLGEFLREQVSNNRRADMAMGGGSRSSGMTKMPSALKRFAPAPLVPTRPRAAREAPGRASPAAAKGTAAARPMKVTIARPIPIIICTSDSGSPSSAAASRRRAAADSSRCRGPRMMSKIAADCTIIMTWANSEDRIVSITTLENRPQTPPRPAPPLAVEKRTSASRTASAAGAGPASRTGGSWRVRCPASARSGTASDRRRNRSAWGELLHGEGQRRDQEEQPDQRRNIGHDAHAQMHPADRAQPLGHQDPAVLQIALAPAPVTGGEVDQAGRDLLVGAGEFRHHANTPAARGTSAPPRRNRG